MARFRVSLGVLVLVVAAGGSASAAREAPAYSVEQAPAQLREAIETAAEGAR